MEIDYERLFIGESREGIYIEGTAPGVNGLTGASISEIKRMALNKDKERRLEEYLRRCFDERES